MSRAVILINFILFQIGWFACVLGGAHGLPWLGTLLALLILAWHLSQAAHALAELKLLLLALVIGLGFESLLVTLGFNRYPSGQLLDHLAPHWMIMMWPLFASTLNVSMRWIKPLHPLILGVAGAVLAPLSYYAGSKLNAVDFTDIQQALLAIALGWCILFPLLVIASRSLNGFPDVTLQESNWSKANV